MPFLHVVVAKYEENQLCIQTLIDADNMRIVETNIHYNCQDAAH